MPVGFLLLTSVHAFTSQEYFPSWRCRMADIVNEYRAVFEDFPAYGSVLLRLANH
jgi:hypothetical protein